MNHHLNRNNFSQVVKKILFIYHYLLIRVKTKMVTIVKGYL